MKGGDRDIQSRSMNHPALSFQTKGLVTWQPSYMNQPGEG